MDDYIASGFGSQATDQAIASSSFKPVWHLKPLPLHPSRTFVPPSRSSLHSLCLAKISHDFQLYTPELLAGLPPTIIERILRRVRADRGYEASYDQVQRNPDVTTMWAYSALLDPDGADTQVDHVIGLPLDNTIHHLKPDEHALESGTETDAHPLIQIPKLWNRLNPSSSYALLTTLTLDGINDIVNDSNLVHLRYCTHLTLLWTRGCKITDMGVRLLASALDLPGRRGLCRLRGWFMPGCTGVSDRSMRSLARWPGLCALDTRGTSVTEAGMGIFNRFSRLYFGGENADMQPVTSGLLGLFAEGAGGAEVLEALCLTLLAGDAPGRSDPDVASQTNSEGQDRWWLALHVQPTTQDFDPAWLPYQHNVTDIAEPKPSSTGGVYRPGIGMVYGQGAKSIGDTVGTFRDSVKMALRIQAEEEGLADRDLTVYRWDPGETRKQYKRRVEKHERGIASRHAKEAKAQARADLAAAKEEAERERSKAFVGGRRGAGKGRSGRQNASRKESTEKAGGERGPVEGKRELMLVRMVAPNWEALRWASATTTTADATGSVSQVRTAQSTTTVDLIADIMGTQRTRTPMLSSSSPGQPFSSASASKIERKRPPSPASSSDIERVKLEPLGTAAPSRASSNPFKRHAAASQDGIRPLSQNRATSTPTQPSGIASPSSEPMGHRAGAIKKLDEDFDFGGGSKRRFEGKAQESATRRGMKMFSGRRP